MLPRTLNSSCMASASSMTYASHLLLFARNLRSISNLSLHPDSISLPRSTLARSNLTSSLTSYRSCVYHLFCIGAIIAFFNSLRTSNTKSLFLWVPLGTQIGILVAVGLQECASIVWRNILSLLLSLLDGLRGLMGTQQCLLPLYEGGQHQPVSATLTLAPPIPEGHIYPSVNAFDAGLIRVSSA